ncbi:MAG: cytochrome c biogenesis protein CcsA [Prevotella sp.]|nr:cytochrome c biogenesis protein CcsA [Prevotella sp.]MBR3080395.1 cytochrome c biogenesis protein CcsA [Prevotella sp.]
MWNRPWSMKEGFLIGGGLILAGLALELSAGQVKWDAFAWPVNGFVYGGFLALIVIVFLLRKKVYAFQFLSTYQAAIPAMAYAVTLTIIMGLTRQKVGGTWLNDMLSFWPFVFIYVYVTVILGAVTLKRLYQIVNRKSSNRKWLDFPFLLNHLGLFLALTAATLGNADMQRLKMITVVGEPEWRALDANGVVKEMPLAIELKKFIMETYDNGSPKRFASEIQILTKTKKNIETVIDVNKPYEVDGWKIYQYGYDTQMGADSQISILELVSDPWLPLVYTGIYMMLAGTVLLVLYTRWRMKRLLPIGVLLVVALAIVSYLIPVFRSNLVPALQSPWFYPHILVYIVCYSLMGVAAVIAIYGLIKRPLPSYISPLTSSLVYVGLIFMTFGMMFGAFWAKEAWGHYWSWDPKETWAAITWLSYLVYIHYRLLPRHKERLALWMLIISFVLLQMCWWGINYLPSAQGSSVHTYQTN